MSEFDPNMKKTNSIYCQSLHRWDTGDSYTDEVDTDQSLSWDTVIRHKNFNFDAILNSLWKSLFYILFNTDFPKIAIF